MYPVVAAVNISQVWAILEDEYGKSTVIATIDIGQGVVAEI